MSFRYNNCSLWIKILKFSSGHRLIRKIPLLLSSVLAHLACVEYQHRWKKKSHVRIDWYQRYWTKIRQFMLQKGWCRHEKKVWTDKNYRRDLSLHFIFIWWFIYICYFRGRCRNLFNETKHYFTLENWTQNKKMDNIMEQLTMWLTWY